MFGGQSVWLEDTLLVCGGANWTSSHDHCYSWSNRWQLDIRNYIQMFCLFEISTWITDHTVKCTFLLVIFRPFSKTANNHNYIINLNGYEINSLHT